MNTDTDVTGTDIVVMFFSHATYSSRGWTPEDLSKVSSRSVDDLWRTWMVPDAYEGGALMHVNLWHSVMLGVYPR